MSVALIKPYFLARMKALGFSEWDNPRWDNIPENKLNKSFHLELGEFRKTSSDQRTINLSCPVVVRAFFKGSRNESAIDKAIEATDGALTEILSATNRLSVSGLKNISFESGESKPISEENNADAMLTMNFTALVVQVT